MTEWCVTVNAGGAIRTAHHEGMLAWAREAAARQPAFVFAQEVPSAKWLSVWEHGYRSILGFDRGWKVRSALLARRDLDVVSIDFDADPRYSTLRYHGNYVAAGIWRSAMGPVAVASIHASPNEAEPATYGWDGGPVTARNGGNDPRYVRDRLWDSDLLLATLSRIARGAATGATPLPILAAGDLNEALAADLDPTGEPIGTWAKEYFDRVRIEGLQSWLHDRWPSERATYRALQLDHVLVTAADAHMLGTEEPHLESSWASDAATVLSDHIPIWFPLSTDWTSTSPSPAT